MPTLLASELYQLRFEHQRVKMLIAAHDFPDAVRKEVTAEVRETGRRQWSDGYLTFRALDASNRLRSCPVRLQARSFPGEYFDRLTVSRLLNFEKTHLYQTYLAGWAFREDGDERPFGLVVGMPNVHGGVIIHDADLPGLTGRSTLVHRSVDPGEPPAITVEPYTAFLRRLVKHWRGGEPLPVVGPRDEIRPRLERWMVKRLGTGPAVVVLAWLYGAWDDPHKRYVTMRDGAARLCVTQSVIARRSGLGPDSVKLGLARLKREGLIATSRGDRRTYVTLVAG
jgi:hypothetical protein